MKKMDDIFNYTIPEQSILSAQDYFLKLGEFVWLCAKIEDALKLKIAKNKNEDLNNLKECLTKDGERKRLTLGCYKENDELTNKVFELNQERNNFIHGTFIFGSNELWRSGEAIPHNIPESISKAQGLLNRIKESLS